MTCLPTKGSHTAATTAAAAAAAAAIFTRQFTLYLQQSMFARNLVIYSWLVLILHLQHNLHTNHRSPLGTLLFRSSIIIADKDDVDNNALFI